VESTVQKKNLPLVYYRMPHEKDVWFIQGECAPLEIDSLQNVPSTPGFILYPGVASSSNPLFIQTDKQIRMPLEDLYAASLDTAEIWKLQSLPTNEASIAKEEYCKKVANAVELISSGELQKVVLSRIKNIQGITPENPLKIFYELCNKYPAAFVSLVYIPGNLLWITATPELLISANKNEIKTVSLSGTKPVNNTDGWGEKEKTEQKIVTDYISQVLGEDCENIRISTPEEVIAGNVKHLKTSFSATLKIDLWSLVSKLHPTPAVCGFPLNKAKHFIEQTEGYDRKYYTGFLGLYNVEGKTDLFVNLRCAELFANGVNLYVGGGITKDSIPNAEWEETELKAKTLLFAFEKIKHEA